MSEAEQFERQRSVYLVPREWALILRYLYGIPATSNPELQRAIDNLQPQVAQMGYTEGGGA